MIMIETCAYIPTIIPGENEWSGSRTMGHTEVHISSLVRLHRSFIPIFEIFYIYHDSLFSFIDRYLQGSFCNCRIVGSWKYKKNISLYQTLFLSVASVFDSWSRGFIYTLIMHVFECVVVMKARGEAEMTMLY